jgi:hypothetical protein
MKKKARLKFRRSRSLSLPELQLSKTAVLNTLGSLESKRAYEYAMDERSRRRRPSPFHNAHVARWKRSSQN